MGASLYDAAVAADVIVIKALKVSEVAQIASTEVRLRDWMIARFEARAKSAVKSAAKAMRDGAGAEAIKAIVDDKMRPWSGEVIGRFNKEWERVYRLARVAGSKRVQGKIKTPLVYDVPTVEPNPDLKVTKAIGEPAAEFGFAFDLADEAALAAAKNKNTFWIGEMYDETMSTVISDTVAETSIAAGASRAEAAKLLTTRLTKLLGTVSMPTGYTGTLRSYVEGIVANALTTARVQGQIKSFTDLGVTTYEIVNPQDERTCPVCGHMDGKVFTTKQATTLIEEEIAAESPAAVKAVHPWLSLAQMLDISPKPGFQSTTDSTSLADAKFNLPPFHFRCRCTVDISEESESFESLEPTAL